MDKKYFDRNVKLICLFKAFQMALFPLAIITLFWQDHVEMSLVDIMTVQAVLAGVIVVAEFPSGYIADRLGYKNTLLFSAVLSAVGWSLYLVADSFWMIIAAEMLYGLSMAFVSGTDHSLMYESLCEVGNEHKYAKWSGRMQFFSQSAEGLAALSAAAAYALHFRFPFFLEVVISMANIVVAMLLVEPHRIKPKFEKSFHQIRDIMSHVLFRKPVLRDLIVLSLFLGLSSFIPVWLIQLYAKDAGAGLQALSVNWCLANIVVALGAISSFWFKSKWGFHSSIIFCIALVVAGYLGLGLNHMSYGFVFYYLITFMRGLNGPLLMNEKQKHVTSENRAGMLSVQSLVFRLSFMLVGPVVGLCVDRWGMHSVFLVLGIVLGIASYLAYLFVAKKMHTAL